MNRRDLLKGLMLLPVVGPMLRAKAAARPDPKPIPEYSRRNSIWWIECTHTTYIEYSTHEYPVQIDSTTLTGPRLDIMNVSYMACAGTEHDKLFLVCRVEKSRSNGKVYLGLGWAQSELDTIDNRILVPTATQGIKELMGFENEGRPCRHPVEETH